METIIIIYNDLATWTRASILLLAIWPFPPFFDDMERQKKVYEKDIRHISHVKDASISGDARRVFSGLAPGLSMVNSRADFEALLNQCESLSLTPAYGGMSLATLDPISIDKCVGCGRKMLTERQERLENERMAAEAMKAEDERKEMINEIGQTREQLRNAKTQEEEYRSRLSELRLHYDRAEDSRHKMQNDMKEVFSDFP
jgi:hypothetical protein